MKNTWKNKESFLWRTNNNPALTLNQEIPFATTPLKFNKTSLFPLNRIFIKGRLWAKRIKLLKIGCLNNHRLGFFINVLNVKNNNTMEKVIDAWVAHFGIEIFALAAQIWHYLNSKIFAIIAVINQSNWLHLSKIRNC